MLHFAEELLLFLLDEQNGTLLPITARTERLAFAGAVLMGAATGRSHRYRYRDADADGSDSGW